MKDLNDPPPPLPLVRRGRGRPVFVPTKEQRVQVQIQAGCGLPHEMMAAQIMNPETHAAIDAKTLRKVFRAELDSGRAVANGLVAQSLFKKATGTGPQSVTAAIFWLKAQAGWKDKTHVQIETNAPGDAAQVHELPEDEFKAECEKYGIPYDPPSA